MNGREADQWADDVVDDDPLTRRVDLEPSDLPLSMRVSPPARGWRNDAERRTVIMFPTLFP